MNPWLILLGIAVVGAVFVVIPAARYAYSRYRRPRLLRCPNTGSEARVTVDPARAAAAAAFGKAPEVERCSLWPKLRLCREECLSVPIEQTRAARSSWTPVPRARIQKILVPLDGSPGSESVLWTVAQLARAQGARVRLVRVARVADAVRGDDDRVIAYADQESERVETEERAKLRRVADRLTGITVETAVRFGDPATQIIDEAETIGADLIALATHHRSGLARVLQGSVAERVERGTPVPVVLVPYGEPEAALS